MPLRALIPGLRLWRIRAGGNSEAVSTDLELTSGWRPEALGREPGESRIVDPIVEKTGSLGRRRLREWRNWPGAGNRRNKEGRGWHVASSITRG